MFVTFEYSFPPAARSQTVKRWVHPGIIEKSEMKVYLADLQNSYYRYIRNSVPIGMGFVAAYLQKRFGDDITIRQFRKFEELHEALAEESPDLVAFGSYSWNTLLTLKSATYIKTHHPDTLIAVGGPDVSQNFAITSAELKQNPQVDFYMANEGEGPTANIIATFLSKNDPAAVKKTEIPGCISRQPNDDGHWGQVIARFDEDINAIPSPYLDGTMDRFLADPDYLPIIQTSRGCPYRCTFCVSGKETWSKVKMFDMDRVKAEIDYIEKNAANRYMRFADENFGILPRDVEIAEYLMETKNETGFPHAVSIYTDKHPTDRVKHISWLLRDMMPFNISYQSATHDVLSNIKRINLKDGEVGKAVSYAREKDLTLVSELIFALPGESKASFLSSIDKLISLRFESIAVNQLRILKGSEMDLPEDREKYDVQTMFAMSENGYTTHPDVENIEIDEWVVANNTLPGDEYFQMNRFIFLFDLAHYRSYLKELIFFFECHGIRATDLLMGVLERPDDAPILSGQAEKFEAGMRRMLHSTAEAAEQYVREMMRTDPESIEGIYRLEDNLVIEIMMNNQFDEVIREVSDIGIALYQEQRGALPAGFLEELALICNIVSLCAIPPVAEVAREIVIESKFDILSWIATNYEGPLSNYILPKTGRVGLRIRGLDVYQNLWEMTDETDLNKYKKVFATVNSANRRRQIVAPTDEAKNVKSPMFGMTYGFAQDVQVPLPDLSSRA
jgi:radical SAM superfamily enzyme YgiQ (UPF0313 family)